MKKNAGSGNNIKATTSPARKQQNYNQVTDLLSWNSRSIFCNLNQTRLPVTSSWPFNSFLSGKRDGKFQLYRKNDSNFLFTLFSRVRASPDGSFQTLPPPDTFLFISCCETFSGVYISRFFITPHTHPNTNLFI